MSDTSRVALRYWKETTFATVTGSPKFTNMRFTGESLRQDTSTTSSQEIVADRQVPDVIRTNVGASGQINLELSYGAYDAFFEAGLLSANWTAEEEPISGAITISFESIATAGAGYATINDSANGLATYNVGAWLRVTGADEPENTAVCKIVAVSAGSLSVIVANSIGDFVDEAAGEAVTITQAAIIENGVTLRTFAIEKQFTDLSNDYELFLGMAVDQLAFNVDSEGVLTGSITFLGARAESRTATVGDGSPTAITTGAVMNSIDNVLAVLSNYGSGSAGVFDVTQFSATIQNNLRQRTQIGTLGAISIGTGVIGVSGSLTSYYTGATTFNRYLNFTTTSIAFVLTDADGNYFIIDFPRVKFTQGQRAAGAVNQDVFNELTFTAYKHPTEPNQAGTAGAVTVRMARIAA